MDGVDSGLTLLLGGGIDSTTLIPFYLRRDVPIRGIHFDYGQASLTGELRAVRAICCHYSVPLQTIRLGFPLSSRNGEYRGRNALLALAAASLATRPHSVAIGIHAGVPYYDSSATFVADLNRLFDGYFDGVATVQAPFTDFTKAQVYAFAVQSQVPIELTFSCERRSDGPCGACPSCRDREALRGGE
ncbi:MAG: 7-cyano-7-deazaguanine synthase [Thermomicrobiales bacterium]